MASADALPPELALIAEAFAGDPTVASYRAFGSVCLTTNGKIFAFVHKGRLVVKLGAPAADAMVAAGDGERFQMGARTMKGWAAVRPERQELWLDLARRARAFVG